MFGLEFSEISERPRDYERIDRQFNELNESLLRNLETGRKEFEFYCAVDSFRNSLDPYELSAISRNNPTLFQKLNALRKQSYKITTLEELETLKQQLEQIKSSQTSMQVATTAQAELAVKQAASGRKPIITDVPKEVTETMSDAAKSTVKTTQPPAAKVVMDEAAIKAEAAARTQAQQQAAANAEKAQKFYSSLSDATTGKSAAESAQVIEEAAIKAEAAARTQAQQQAAANAEKAQKFYSSLSDATTGKSAAESAQVIEEAAIKAEAAARTQAQQQAAANAKKAINNTDDVVKNNKNLKDSILKVIKSKKFKYGAIAAAVIIAATAIFAGVKKKNEKNKNINVIK